MTEVPWIFAAPTGANKVTVYWDGVPGATGYRVRWGTVSGSYPSASEVLSGSVRRYTVSGLMSEQEHYFVVEAEWNGVWGPPSEEDSAVPHSGAIPWDTQDPNQIIPAIRNTVGAFGGDVSALAPDGYYYTEISGVRRRDSTAPFSYNATENIIQMTDGGILMPTPQTEEIQGLQRCTRTGPYRRIKTSSANFCVGARGQFYLPPLGCISIDPATHGSSRDTPYVYFGMAYGVSRRRVLDIEGGVSFHPAQRGIRRGGREEGTTENSPPPNYSRWKPHLKVYDSRRSRNNQPVVLNPGDDISYGMSGQNAPYGFMLGITLRLMDEPRYRTKAVVLELQVWRVLIDGEDPYLTLLLVSAADLPFPGTNVRARRVISIAQRVDLDRNPEGWVRTNSWFCDVGIGYQPRFDAHDLEFISAFCDGWWQCWIPNLTGEVVNCPPSSPIFSIDEDAGERTCGGTSTGYYREIVGIDLRRR